MTALVYVPLGRGDAAALRDGADLGPRAGCAPTGDLARQVGPDAVPDEVEFAALAAAGVLALRGGSDARRLVLAADVDPGQVADPGQTPGEVVVTGLRWPQVQSLFADEPAAAEAVARARAAVTGLGLADALTAPAVEELLAAYDLLWFAPGELDHL